MASKAYPATMVTVRSTNCVDDGPCPACVGPVDASEQSHMVNARDRRRSRESPLSY